MTEAPLSDRDPETGQFKLGHIGIGGRPRGARNYLTGEFLDDLREAWAVHGKSALAECATKDPVAFCRLVGALVPAKAELDVSLDLSGAETVLSAYRTMAGIIGADADVAVRSLRRVAPHLIEHVER